MLIIKLQCLTQAEFQIGQPSVYLDKTTELMKLNYQIPQKQQRYNQCCRRVSLKLPLYIIKYLSKKKTCNSQNYLVFKN